MILVIDVGNTNMVLGIYRGEDLIGHWRVATDHQKTADEYGVLFKQLLLNEGIDSADVQRVIISSVVPPLVVTLEKVCTTYFRLNPHIVGPGTKTGMNIRMNNPHEVGADRIVNAVAAYHLYGGPVIIVDFGTASTFCLVNAQGDYLGGAIAPGVGIAAEALISRASKLPKIELIKPEQVIGKNTVASMQAGIIYGFVALVDGLVMRIQAEIAEKAHVVATGGLALLIGSESKTIETINPLLTLQGLLILDKMNCYS